MKKLLPFLLFQACFVPQYACTPARVPNTLDGDAQIQEAVIASATLDGMVIGCTACSPDAAPPPFIPAVGDSARCSYVCAHLTSLKCSKALGGGPACLNACVNNEKLGAYNMHLECLYAAGTCDAAFSCNHPK